jgi:hypothetical protein
MPWPTQLDVLLRPGEVRVTRRPLLLPSRGAGVVQTYPVSAGQSQEAWRASVEVLGMALAEQTTARAAQIVVSDHFLRYALVPWNENLVADAERLAFARLALSEIYGNMAQSWAVSLDEQPAGHASLACAIDRELLEMLRQVTAACGQRLTAVSAALAQRINRHRAALREPVFCLASLEPARLTLAFRNEAGWLAVRTRRVNSNPLESLSGVLRQEAAAAGAADGGTLYLVADAAASLPAFNLPSWNITRLDDGGAGRVLPAGGLARMAAE